MECNAVFEAGFGCGILVMTLCIILKYLCYKRAAVPVIPFRCPRCDYTEVVVEAVAL